MKWILYVPTMLILGLASYAAKLQFPEKIAGINTAAVGAICLTVSLIFHLKPAKAILPFLAVGIVGVGVCALVQFLTAYFFNV